MLSKQGAALFVWAAASAPADQGEPHPALLLLNQPRERRVAMSVCLQLVETSDLSEGCKTQKHFWPDRDKDDRCRIAVSRLRIHHRALT